MHIGTCKLFSVIVLNLLGVGLLILSQNTTLIVRNLAAKNAILSDGSQAAETFSTPPVSTYLKFYFFDLKNLEEVREGGTPIVEEKGPYTFSIQAEKNMTWNDTEITYDPKKIYFFEESLSEGLLTDSITTLNPGSMAAAKWGDPPYLFSTATVDDFLLKGLQIGEDVFGYFTDKNDTSEGLFTAFTGQGDIEKLNEIISVDGKTETPNGCEPIRGTNGERFSPFVIPPAKLTLYSPALCRPWDLHYSKLVKVNHLDCVRFENGRDFFSQTLNKTLDECLQDGMNPKDIGIQGIFDPQSCGNVLAPILYSLPHFLNADTELLENVQGLNASESKHNFYVDVYPALGSVQDMRIRVQVNFRLKAISAHPKMKETIYPVFWQEMMLSTENSNEAASIVYKKVEFVGNAFYWVALSLGALFILVAEILLLSGMCLKSRHDDDRE